MWDMHQNSSDRFATWWRMLIRPTWWWLLLAPFGPLAVFGHYRAFRDEFLSPYWQERLNLSVVDWQIWIVIALIMVIIIILESGYCEIRKHKQALDEVMSILSITQGTEDSQEIQKLIVERVTGDDVKRLKEQDKIFQRERDERVDILLEAGRQMLRHHGHLDWLGLCEAWCAGEPFDGKPCTFCQKPRFQRGDPKIL